MRQKIKPGSPFLFCLIKTLNLFFGAAALALFALAIWLWTQLGSFSIIEIVFLSLGLFQILLVILAWKADTSTPRLKCYMFLMSILFILELVAVIIVFALGDKIIDKVATETGSQQQLQKFQQLKKYLYIVNYFVIGNLAVQLVLILFVNCYIGSVRNKNYDYDYRVVDTQGHKLTVQEKIQNDKKLVQEKYAKKRQQLKQKYPGYKQTGN